MKEYVTRVDGAYRVGGTRVSLDSVVNLFHEGMSPESIVESYSSLSLEQVYGAITYYLAHRNEVDEYLAETEGQAEVEHAKSRMTNAELIAKIRRARHETKVSG